ncbi:hypothetical protein Patl1_10488 [Pistacia atlantica]|uniref:Uncharacterized protein n=1 Tax=Pistacia atlantica TaxID=434234 RepID=A0ACC1A2V5_9ROSI|nr:hypothetical protein Patl1_10488 [Pistacia atlantica]
MSCLAIEATNTTTDRSSLLALKARITNDPHNFLANNWSAATSVCHWIGITCDVNNRVTVLNLTSMALTGTIPPHIGNLSSLVQISFSNNSFHGSLPMELVNLRSLELMNFEDNNLEGEMPSCISTLRTLDFMNNDLHGYIPNEIGNLVNLERFILYGNPLISGPIPSAMFNNSSLKNINFAMNRMSGSLPDNMCQNLPVLKYLILHHNQFVGSIPSSLWQCKELVRISLDNNRFTGTIPRSIGKLNLLKELYLDNNNLEGEIPEELGSLKALERLRTGINHRITGSIPRSLANCTSLWELGLGGSSLTGPIPPELGDLPNLVILNLYNNSLTGPIPSTIFNISTLELLALYMNQLSGHLPSDIGLWLPNLRKLYLWDNQLQGIIPNSISNASNLDLLALSLNSFSGPLPTTLGNLRNLERIDLASNQLTRDSFTTELSFLSPLSNCKHLRRIVISDNPLNGTLPASIGNLTSVEIFKADNCQIKGSISQEVGKLSNLTTFSLGNNELIGSIPSCSWKNENAPNLSGNSLIGAIPKSLEKLLYLKHINVSFNRLQGEIPTGGSFANFSAESFMGNSALCGATQLQVPPCKASTHLGSKSKKRNANFFDTEDGLTLATWQRISYAELGLATNGFNESNLLGTGGFGSVYKGKLSDGTDIAIKVFNLQRLNIMIDVASALEYLHHGSPTPIIHCDLKPSNVLLDRDLIAHVGDFGIAKLLGDGDSVVQTNTLATIGYMAPEYGSEGIVSARGDIYSFGILLMETFTRKKPTDDMFEEARSLKCWVKEALPDSVTEITDANLLGEENFTAKKDCILSTLELAVDCSVESSERRIDITDVLSTLKKIRTNFEKSVAMT